MIHLFLTLLFTFGSPAAYVSEGQGYDLETLIQQKDVVWGFDFLPDGRIIFTERKGTIRIFDPKTKAVSTVEGAPQVWAKGQGGLLDIRVYEGKIYITYSQPMNGGAATTLAKGILEGNKLTQFQQLFYAKDPQRASIHFGSRIEFDGAGHIFLTSGERNQRSQVQDMNYHMGKIVRMNMDGSGQEIWSYGHRNPQGLTRHPKTGELWEAEFGPLGGDEINVIKKGANYGWPDVTHGREYSGEKIGVETKDGVEEPVVYWVPSISPSAIAFHTGKWFPKWKDNLFVAALSGEHLRRLVINGQKVVKQEELLKDEGLRFRNVRTGPDGFLYISTDDGKIGRIVYRNAK